jgi:phosphatidyl-myo-inositol alpha-mannosyltransferase
MIAHAHERPLRLAITSYYLPSESKIGAGWITHRLANELVRLGHHVTMFSPCRRPDDATYEHTVIAPGGHARTVKWSFVVRNIDYSSFDGLLAQGDDHLIRKNAVAAHIRTLHGSCFDEARYISGFIGRTRMLYLGLTEAVSAIRTREVVGVSAASIRFFPWLHRVIPNGVDIEHFRPLPGVEKEINPTILFVGTYRLRKRGKLLQEAFVDYVLPRVPNAQLWMVCTDAPPAPNVHVLGRLTDDELADRYRRAWVFALPSSYEGFGVPYIEAMASGTAVVATSNRGADEVLEHGALGLVCTPETLGAELVGMLVDRTRRAHYEAQADRARATYSITRIAEMYVDRIRSQLAASMAREETARGHVAWYRTPKADKTSRRITSR